jgi:small subunit ribosomal protein S1
MKGVSDKDAQNNKKIMGDKNNVKKPLQVLHISKKDTKSKNEELVNENNSPSKEINTNNKAVKPQIVDSP